MRTLTVDAAPSSSKKADKESIHGNDSKDGINEINADWGFGPSR
jgi:hypothetical protein